MTPTEHLINEAGDLRLNEYLQTMALTPEEKHARKYNRTLHRFKALTLGKIKNEVAADFQRLRKLECANEVGNVTCVSCGEVDSWNSRAMNAGHYHSRRHSATLLHRPNCWPQCVPCNQHLSGNLVEYRRWLVFNLTPEQLDELDRLKNTTKVFTREELAALKLEFAAELKLLLKRFE